MDFLGASKGLFGAISFFAMVKSAAEILLYISLIILAFKAVQALNIYINNNSK